MNSSRDNKLRDALLISIFIFLIIVPGGAMLFKESQDVLSQEKRIGTPLPDFSATSYSRTEYQEEYESYFNDNFGFRNIILKANSSLLYNVFRTSSSDKALIGDEGWMFYAAEGMINEYTNGNTLSSTDLKDIAGYLYSQQEKFIQEGIVFVVFIAPDKETIYPEYMPQRIEKSSNSSTREVFVEYMITHTSIPILDPTEVLLEEKKNKQLYYTYDSHWNEKGASIAYQLIHQFFEEIYESIDDNDLLFKQIETENEDLATLLLIESEVSEQSFVSEIFYEDYIQDRYTRYDNDVMEIKGESNNPCLHALVLRDSFGTQFLSSMRRDMCKITVLRDYNDMAFIKEKDPDVVILEIAERNLSRLVDGEKATPR